MLRINSPFLAHIITQKKMRSSVIVDTVFNKIKKSIIVTSYLLAVSTINDESETCTCAIEEWETVGEGRVSHVCNSAGRENNNKKMYNGDSVFVLAISVMNCAPAVLPVHAEVAASGLHILEWE